MAENIRLRVRGRQKQAAELPKPVEVHPFPKATPIAEVEIAVAARGTNAELESVELSVSPDSTVIELEFEGGIRQFVHAAQLRDDVRRTAGSRGVSSDGVVEVPSEFGGATTRGHGELVLKALRLLGVDPVGAVADKAVSAAISSFEDKLQPGPGLYRLKDPNNVSTLISDSKQLDASSPFLLFLHGTASSISGSFGGLSPSDSPTGTPDWASLAQHYGDRVLALQHKTFSESPVKNAIDVATLLPTGARLHLVSHSRGGLIGELLSLTDLQDWHFQAFQNAVTDRLADVDQDVRARIIDQRKQEVENIKRLAELIKTKRLTVEKFVRVACPARGTILLSKRLDLYLSVLLNVIGFIPALKSSILYDFLKATVLEIAKRRTDPRELPGIEAMMPESPLVHILNQQNFQSRADLAVISGDLAPEGIWRKLALLAVEVLYLEDNDLVVNTLSMYGGMQRVTTASYFFNKGPHVNHFHYFVNQGTRSRLRDWLLSAAGAKVEGFSPFIPQQKEFKPDTRRAADDTRPVLFLIPDQLGSQLSSNGTLVWMSSSELSTRGLEALKGDLAPTGLTPEYYADLFNALSDSYRIRQFSFDWRKSLLESRDALAQEVREALNGNRPVVIVGHGAGGTLGLLLAGDQELWAQFTRQGGRLLLLGSPLGKSGFAGQLLSPENRLNRYLNLIARSSNVTSEQVFRSFPGVLELADPDLLTRKERSHGERLQKELRFEKLPGNIFYVAGKAAQTPYRITKEGHVVHYTSSGDGHVTWDEPRTLNLPAWLVDVPHGHLTSPVVLPAIRELLARGTTDRLPRLPGAPLVEDAAQTTETPVLYPQDSDLVDAALGGNTQITIATPEEPLRAWVAHGHLRSANYPLIVGHYKDDTIVSAEKVVDRALDGRLTERFAMNVYPGPEGSAEIILAPRMKPRGALITGLGGVGELTQERVRRAITNAVLRYVLAVTESSRGMSIDPTDIGVSALLVGGYGELTIRESVTAIVKGVLEANRQLGTRPNKLARIRSLEFVDLYEDIAIEAAHELLTLGDRLNGDGTSEQTIAVEPIVRTFEGGQASRPRNPYQAGWWRRVSITDNEGILTFSVLTDRAQTSDAIQGTQRRLVESFVQDAVTTVAYDKQLSASLFQLLLPRALQDIASDRVNVVLVVDRESAKYPWELLAQRTRTSVEPLATTCGLVRQFRSLEQQHRKPPASGMATLVIGDTNSGLPALPGAQAEAATVSAKLGPSYDVTLLPPNVDGLRVVTELLSREYRVLHIAAHGEFDAKSPQNSGVVIGNGLHLTPAELKAMLAAPDLAFINCCYLGQVSGGTGDPKAGRHPGPELASGFAEMLMAIGTRAVIVAGWAVYDPAGKAFAERFYDRMLSGESFGEAVLAARQRTQALFGDKNTWGAYQCYGNPDFRLKQQTDSSGLAGGRQWYVSRLEILQRAQDIVSTAKELPKDTVRRQLQDLQERTPVRWRDGEILGVLGKAFAALGDTERAIECYQQALTDESSSARVKQVQDLANLMERAARSKPAEIRDKELERATAILHELDEIIKTGEQSSLLAAFYKRKGQYAEDPGERAAAYQQAMDFYDQAFRKRREIGDPELFYPGINAAGLAYLVRKTGSQNGTVKEREKWKAVLTESVAAAAEKRKQASDFWSRVAPADAFLVQALWDDSIGRQEAEITAAYEDVIRGGGQAFEFDSMLSQIRFLANGSQGTVKSTLEHIWDVLNSLIPREAGS